MLTCNGAKLTISDGCTINASGSTGISGCGSALSYLEIDGGETVVTATGSAGSIVNFDLLDMSGCAIVVPEGAIFNASKRGVVLGDSIVTSKVEIRKDIDYDLWIAGVRVTSNNAASIMGAGISGSVSYSAANKVLTLSSATIESGAYIGIKSRIDGLKIIVSGVSTVSSSSASALTVYNPVTVSGGTLNLSGKDYGVLLADEGAEFCVGKSAVNVSGGNGIVGGKAYVCSVSITDENGVLSAEGANGSIVDITSLTYPASCGITAPDGATFDASKKAVVDAEGNTVIQRVTVSKKTE